MSAHADETVELLERWHGGDRPALERLLERHMPELLDFIERRMASELRALRRDVEPADLVHDTALRLLEYLPRFRPKDGDQFQRLLRTFVRNEVRNLLNSSRSLRRVERDASLGDSVLDLRAPTGSSVHPDRAAQRAERNALTQALAALALQFLEATDRRILELHQYEGCDWSEIARQVDLTPDAARMRHKRAMVRLSSHIRSIKDGRVEELLESAET